VSRWSKLVEAVGAVEVVDAVSSVRSITVGAGATDVIAVADSCVWHQQEIIIHLRRLFVLHLGWSDLSVSSDELVRSITAGKVDEGDDVGGSD